MNVYSEVGLWASICVLSALLSSLSALLLWTKSWRSLRDHFFFLFFYTTVIIYLQIAPVAALLAADVPLSLAVWNLPHPAMFIREYAMLQVASFSFFQLPMVILYFGLTKRKSQAPSILRTTTMRAQIAGFSTTAFALLFLLVAVKNDLLFTRIGSEGISEKLVELPLLEFAIYRSFQESALFLIGILYFLKRRGGAGSLFLQCGFLTNLLIYGYVSLLNSRNSIAFLAVVIFGSWLIVRVRRIGPARIAVRLGFAAGVAVYMFAVVLNVRNTGGGSLRIAHFNPFTAGGLITKTEGASRFDGIDLMARLLPDIRKDGPAWGAAWASSYWLVGRFVDPDGFNESRRSMTDTAKGYLMRRYWGWATTDYLSCRLTDVFGNFYFWGFPILGCIYGWLFAFCRRAIVQPASAQAFIIGMFVLTNILMFEGSADALLFGWVRKLPVLISILAIRPFTLQRQKQDMVSR